MGMVGRLRPGVEISTARAELADIAARPIVEFPRPDWAALRNGLIVTPLRSSVTADGRSTGLVLLGASALLLVIACVNLAILLVARSLRRGDEMAVRTALGAGRGRLGRQLTTESVLLAGLGGALGIGVGDRVAMLEHAWYSVISPEGCAAILWKEANEKTNDLAASALSLTARQNLENGLIDDVLTEPAGGAHRDPAAAARSIETWVLDQLRDLVRLKPDTLVRRRFEKYRAIGAVTTRVADSAASD